MATGTNTRRRRTRRASTTQSASENGFAAADVATGAVLGVVDAAGNPLGAIRNQARRLRRRGQPVNKQIAREAKSTGRQVADTGEDVVSGRLPERFARRGVRLVRRQARRDDVIGDIAFGTLSTINKAVKRALGTLRSFESESELPTREGQRSRATRTRRSSSTRRRRSTASASASQGAASSTASRQRGGRRSTTRRRTTSRRSQAATKASGSTKATAQQAGSGTQSSGTQTRSRRSSGSSRTSTAKKAGARSRSTSTRQSRRTSTKPQQTPVTTGTETPVTSEFELLGATPEVVIGTVDVVETPEVVAIGAAESPSRS